MNDGANRQTTRSPFQGVSEIARFNWPRYAAAIVVLLAACFSLRSGIIPVWMKPFVIAAAMIVIWWSVAALIVSYWVYDRSELMRWDWVKRELPSTVNRWLNVHAGLDESTPMLRDIWPNAAAETVDIFAPDEMTEGSIHRARSEFKTSARQVDYRALPFGPERFDSIFLLFAVHELRNSGARRAFFGEIHRVLAPEGTVVLVEHLRDFWNFAAYGPGVFHFHSRHTWHSDATAAHLKIDREFCFTPFVHVFILKKEP